MGRYDIKSGTGRHTFVSMDTLQLTHLVICRCLVRQNTVDEAETRWIFILFRWHGCSWRTTERSAGFVRATEPIIPSPEAEPFHGSAVVAVCVGEGQRHPVLRSLPQEAFDFALTILNLMATNIWQHPTCRRSWRHHGARVAAQPPPTPLPLPPPPPLPSSLHATPQQPPPPPPRDG